jgi:hypothetical protein
MRFSFPVGVRIFLLSTASGSALGPTQPPIQWVPGATSPRVKRPGREADHLLIVPTSRTRGAKPPPSIIFHGLVLS